MRLDARFGLARRSRATIVDLETTGCSRGTAAARAIFASESRISSCVASSVSTSRRRAGGRVDAAGRVLSTPTVSSLSRDWSIRTILSSAIRRFSSRSRSLRSEGSGVPGGGGVVGGSRRIAWSSPSRSSSTRVSRAIVRAATSPALSHPSMLRISRERMRSVVGRAMPNSVSSTRASKCSVRSPSSASFLDRPATVISAVRDFCKTRGAWAWVVSRIDDWSSCISVSSAMSRDWSSVRSSTSSRSMDRAKSSRDFASTSSAADWSSAAGPAAVLPRPCSADRIDALARIRSFRKATPTSPSRAEVSSRRSVVPRFLA